MTEIEKTCENCLYQTESQDGVHCKDCIHNSLQKEMFVPNLCQWKLEDEEANLYVTGCEQRHIIFDGTPKENGYTYCPYCGKKIKVVE